jgi:hypothetical protein
MAEPTNPVPDRVATELPIQPLRDEQTNTRRTLRLSPSYDKPSPARAPMFRR